MTTESAEAKTELEAACGSFLSSPSAFTSASPPLVGRPPTPGSCSSPIASSTPPPGVCKATSGPSASATP
eukprot:1274500-Lingulodinium_polyedra.AAC.1